MAFAVRSLSVLAYANGFTLWHYKAGCDDQNSVAAERFFAEAGDMLAVGDMLIVSTLDGGRLLYVTSDGNQLTTSALN